MGEKIYRISVYFYSDADADDVPLRGSGQKITSVHVLFSLSVVVKHTVSPFELPDSPSVVLPVLSGDSKLAERSGKGIYIRLR